MISSGIDGLAGPGPAEAESGGRKKEEDRSNNCCKAIAHHRPSHWLRRAHLWARLFFAVPKPFQRETRSHFAGERQHRRAYWGEKVQHPAEKYLHPPHYHTSSGTPVEAIDGSASDAIVEQTRTAFYTPWRFRA